MTEPPTIDLATADQLIDELMSRPTFIGIIVAVEADVKGDRPPDRAPMAIHGSAKLTLLDRAKVLADGTRRLIEAEQRKAKGV